MREWYRKYFFVPKQGKVNENNMMRRIALSVAFMVICMGAMSMSAYAFVTWNVTSGVNVIKSAHFDKNVQALSRAAADENDIYTLTGGEHSFTLGHGGDAVTGYYKILIDDDRDSLLAYDPDEGNDVKWLYYSRQIKEEGGDQTITITVPDGKTVYVEFVAEWGTYSGNDAVTEIILDADDFSAAVESQDSDNKEPAKPVDSSDQTKQTEPTKAVEDSTNGTDKETEPAEQEQQTTVPSEEQITDESEDDGAYAPDSQTADQPSY